MSLVLLNRLCEEYQLPLHIRWQSKYYYSKCKNEIIAINFTCKVLEHRLTSKFVLEHKENKTRDIVQKEHKLLKKIHFRVRNNINVFDEFISFLKLIRRSKEFPEEYFEAIEKLDKMHEDRKMVRQFGYGGEHNRRFKIYFSLLNEEDKNRAIKFYNL